MKREMGIKSILTLLAVVTVFALQNCCAYANIQKAFSAPIKAESSCHHQTDAAKPAKQQHDCCDKGPCKTLKMVDTAKPVVLQKPVLLQTAEVLTEGSVQSISYSFEQGVDESPHLPPSVFLSLFPSHAPPAF